MPIQTHHKMSHPQSAPRSGTKISAMAFAAKVQGEYKEMVTGHRNGRYKFVAGGLSAYRKFLTEPTSYEVLCAQDNISALREKPELQTTSRLVIYYLTSAHSEAERNAAGKYAVVVDYLHAKQIPNRLAHVFVRKAGGITAILEKARGHNNPKPAHQNPEASDVDHEEDERDDGPDSDEGASNPSTVPKSTTQNGLKAIFDPADDIAVRVSPADRETILDLDNPSDEVFFLKCKRTGLVGGKWTRICGQLFDPLSE